MDRYANRCRRSKCDPKAFSGHEGLNDRRRVAPQALTAAQREALVKEWADFWWQIAARPAGGDSTNVPRGVLRSPSNHRKPRSLGKRGEGWHQVNFFT